MQTKTIEDILRAHAGQFSPVVPWKKNDKLLRMNFTASNTDLTDVILLDTHLFSNYVSVELARHGAVYGIGGYNEHRSVYNRSRVFDAPDGGEPRRLHLGTDIWGAHHTNVMAPLDGIVHSFAFNNAYGDYGATIILAHNLNGITFYTLYGHLSLNSIKDLSEGMVIRKGDVFCEFGMPDENGHWPPHLHFQVIKDMQGKKGDYPGVCRFSEREQYLANCPDPDLILGMMAFAS